MKSGAVGTVSCTRLATGYANTLQLRIFGDQGALRIDLDRSWTEFEVCRGKNRLTPDWKTVRCKPAPSIIRRFGKALLTGEPDQPDFHDGASVQKVLDACFESDTLQQPITV